MESFVKEFEHLKIQLEDIKSATNNFSKTKVIGSGGFGPVYGGELSCFKGHGMVAIKCLDRRCGQGDIEFWKEITILTRHKHENLITLLGFCIEGGMMILVYEYASNGSLDGHLSSTNFTWTQRLKTCLGAAKGLSFLHDAKGTKERVIHRDIKSANILLDANWNAKVSDMGLSKIAPANQQHTGLFTNAVGTHGYCDPLYMQTYFLTKESDVYSFGVLLFEVLCGRLCFGKKNGQFQVVVPMWKESYKQNKLQEIIFDDLKQQIDQNALKTYSNIAFKCLQIPREERPTMLHVVEELETALTYQELFDRVKLPKDYKNMLLNAAVPLNDSSESEMKMLLLKGILINSGKTWLSRNMNGYNCELISIAKCLTPSASESQHFISSPEYTSRFAVGCYEPLGGNFITCIETQFLSPQTMYTVNLVFKRKNSKDQYIGLEYKLVEEEHSSYLFVSDERDDGWLTLELYQFSSHQQKIKLEIVFYSKYCPDLLVESIEFRPLEKVEDEVLRVEDVDMKPESDTEENWKQKLPIDYEEIVRWHSVQWRTMKELYYILCEGFLINDGKEWFSIAKDGKKCLMLPAKAILKEKEWEWKLKPETRFGQVADCVSKRFGITCKISAKMLSPQTKYTSYLVYSGQPHEKNDINPPLQVVNIYSEEKCNIFLSAPKTPVINWNEEEKTFNPSSRTKIKGLPKLRSDGWMEVQVHDFQTPESDYSIYLRFSSYDMKSLKGITVLGLEFRPI